MMTTNGNARTHIDHPVDALRAFSGRLEVFAALSRASLEAHWYAQQNNTSPDPDLVLPENLALALRELSEDFARTTSEVAAWFDEHQPVAGAR